MENGVPCVEPPTGLLRLVGDLEPALILVGIPLHMDGSEGEMAAEARRFARRLGELTGVAVEECDERLTTVEAEERMRELGGARRGRGKRGRRDMLAAAIMLEEFLSQR